MVSLEAIVMYFLNYFTECNRVDIVLLLTFCQLKTLICVMFGSSLLLFPLYFPSFSGFHEDTPKLKFGLQSDSYQDYIGEKAKGTLQIRVKHFQN